MSSDTKPSIGTSTGTSSGTYDTLLVDIADGVAVVTLNRPSKRNAMSPTLHREMTQALAALRDDDAVRAVVFTGAGDFFCAAWT